MSSNPSEVATGGSSGGSESNYTYNSERATSTRVFVNGVRLPAAETDIHLRKEGPLAITRYAEATFASPWDGRDFLAEFETTKENQTSPDTLRIETRDGDEYKTLFHGVVTGVGSSAQHENTKMFQCRAQGPAHYLNKIPAGTVFKAGLVDVIDVVEYIQQELNDHLPAEIDVQDPELEPPNDVLTVGNEGPIASAKTFQRNKHTLRDVVIWLQDKIAGRLWLEPTPKGGNIVVTPKPTQIGDSYAAHYFDRSPSVEVITNNALSELRPINTVIVNGQAKQSLGGVGDFEVTVPRKEYNVAKARHTALYKAAGETELSETVKKVDAQSSQEVENEARSRLKRAVDDTTAGSMSVRHNRHITPFDTITAKPTVNETADTDSPEITYEIHRAHYKARPNDHETSDHIELNVGVHTDMETHIEIIDSWEQDAY